MKVYLVEVGYPCEEEINVRGIFSSREEAEKHFNFDRQYTHIHEIELDKVIDLYI